MKGMANTDDVSDQLKLLARVTGGNPLKSNFRTNYGAIAHDPYHWDAS